MVHFHVLPLNENIEAFQSGPQWWKYQLTDPQRYLVSVWRILTEKGQQTTKKKCAQLFRPKRENYQQMFFDFNSAPLT